MHKNHVDIVDEFLCVVYGYIEQFHAKDTFWDLLAYAIFS